MFGRALQLVSFCHRQHRREHVLHARPVQAHRDPAPLPARVAVARQFVLLERVAAAAEERLGGVPLDDAVEEVDEPVLKDFGRVGAGATDVGLADVCRCLMVEEVI